MTASLFESGDSFSQVLKDTSTRSLMSIDLGPFQSLDGLLGESLKSSSSLSSSPPRTEELPSSSSAATAAVHHLPPRPKPTTRSNSAAERFMKSMTAILQTKPSSSRSSSSVGNNRTTATASNRWPLPVAPPLVVVRGGGGGGGAGRKRSVSSSSTTTMMSEPGNNLMDSQSWNNLGDYGSVLEQVNYKNVFQTTNTAVATPDDVPPESSSSSSLVQQDNDSQQQDQPTSSSTQSQAPPSPPTTLRVVVYHVPTNNDVLCGKGGRSNNHIGNQRYLKLKDAMQGRYLKAAKNEKKAISQELVDIVQQQWKGRFLKMDKESNNQWYELDQDAARKKCSQALREVNTAEKRAEKRARYNK